MSEAVAATHINPPERIKVGSFGVPLPSLSSAILDLDEEKFLGAGEVGEIALQSPSVMKGYWNAPEENKKKFANIEGQVWMKNR